MPDKSLIEFANKLNEIMPVMMREFSKRQVEEIYQGHITLPQFLIMDCIQSRGESKMTDLANFMKVTTAAMTGIVERLVKSGYVERVFDPEDRRIIRIKLNAKGSGFLKRAEERRREVAINIFGQLSKKERDDYLKIANRIVEILNSEKES